jgi:hypothetical protein
LDYEEAHSCTSLFAFLMLESLRTKYGDQFLKKFCEVSEIYPLVGVAAITLEANVSMTCGDMAEMFKRADYPPQLRSLVNEACKEHVKKPKEYFVQKFLEKCNKDGLKEALEELVNFKIEGLTDKENELLNMAFGRLPQAIAYAQKYDVDVSKPVMQSVLLMSMFISSVLSEVREELEKCGR